MEEHRGKRPGAPPPLGRVLLCCLVLFVLQVSAKDEPLFKKALNPLDSFGEFDWNISRVVASNSRGNVVLSPISLKLALSMLYEGSGGQTQAQLRTALNIENQTDSNHYSTIYKLLKTKDPGYELDIGMKLFVDKEATLKKEFSQKIKDKYNATMENIDFSDTAKAVNIINDWAKSVTRGHIEHLVSDADTKSTTVLLMLNAVYFKGLWLYPFPENSTCKGMFTTLDKTKEEVDYMVAEFVLDYTLSVDLKAQMIRLPYVGEKFAMYIVLPDNDTNIHEVMAKMSTRKARSMINEMTQEPLSLALPKFNFEFASSLAPSLQKIGITKIFSSDADLRSIAEGSKELVVSNVIQKALIDVNEHGTVASAATAVDLVNKFGMQSPIQFNVSRPFAFFIEDETTRTVIFVGLVTNPADRGKGKVAKPSYADVAAYPPAAAPPPQAVASPADKTGASPPPPPGVAASPLRPPPPVSSATSPGK